MHVFTKECFPASERSNPSSEGLSLKDVSFKFLIIAAQLHLNTYPSHSPTVPENVFSSQFLPGYQLYQMVINTIDSIRSSFFILHSFMVTNL
jgi:hypothetical protein